MHAKNRFDMSLLGYAVALLYWRVIFFYSPPINTKLHGIPQCTFNILLTLKNANADLPFYSFCNAFIHLAVFHSGQNVPIKQ